MIAENAIHAIPILLIFSAFVLWFFSTPVLNRKNKDPDKFVSHWFKTNIYKDLYRHETNPMVSERFWKPMLLVPLAPPPLRKKLSRPRVKRIPENGEKLS
ncbi:hypothetical protein ACFE04_011341 [Oxalis oulophora]